LRPNQQTINMARQWKNWQRIYQTSLPWIWRNQRRITRWNARGSYSESCSRKDCRV